MSYIKAETVLPQELIETIQQYVDGKIIYIRHVDALCKDKKHFLFCMENFDDEVRKKEEQRKRIQTIERRARMDELTGIKNNSAFNELSQSIDNRIRQADADLRFGIVMCDINDLKRFNDNRGHSFGDEMVRRAWVRRLALLSRM